MNWEPVQLAYLAGLIDGEGSISVSYRVNTPKKDTIEKRQYHRPFLTIANTDRRMIDWLLNNFGGWSSTHAYPKGVNHKPISVWSARGASLKPILVAVEPYLIIKRVQAKLVIELIDTIVFGRNKLTPDVVDAREAIRAQLRALNKRGVAHV